MSVVVADVAAGRLTADLLARAVIASARAYGDDPLEVLTSAAHRGRRCLPAAASAVSRALRIGLERACVPLGVAYHTVRVARVQKRGAFAAAEAASIRALSYAQWRPEARASAVAVTADAVSVALSDDGCTVYAPEIRATIPPGPVVTAAQIVALRQLARDQPPPLVRREVSEDEDAAERAAAKVRLRAAAAKPATWDLGGAALSDRILDWLRNAPNGTSSLSLATVLDVKESAVASCLRAMHAAGAITPEPMPREGERHQRWMVA